MYSRALERVDGTETQDITSTMEDADMPEAAMGVVFMKKVFRWLRQDVMKKFYTGYNLSTADVDSTRR